MRRIHNRKKKKALHYAAPFVFGVVDLIERSRWALSGADNPIVSLDGGAWVSCGRPKLIIHPIKHLKNLDVEIHVLIHDMIPLHGHVKELRRIWSGPFDAEDGISLELIDELAKSPELDQYLRPLEEGLADLPELKCTPQGAVRLRNGNPGMSGWFMRS